jgi:hypothetical protein
MEGIKIIMNKKYDWSEKWIIERNQAGLEFDEFCDSYGEYLK